MDNSLAKYEGCDKEKIMDEMTRNSNDFSLETKVLLECNAIILLMLSLLFLH